MNVELLNPFTDAIPDEISYTLDEEAHIARFNLSGFFAGAFLAVGRSDGWVAVWDVETKAVAWAAQGHRLQIESVCWSKNSRYLLTASKDCSCVIWDLDTGDRRETIRFDSAVTEATFHPHNSQIILVTLETNEALVIDLRPSSIARHQLEETDLPTASELAEGSDSPPPQDNGKGKKRARTRSEKPNLVTARFSPNGTRIFVGTKQGELLVMDGRSKGVVGRIEVSKSSVRTMEFDRSGRFLVTNSTDRAVRVLAITPDPDNPEEDIMVTPLHKFQDLINRTPWNGVGFSGDGDYVIGGAGHKASHDIFIWDRGEGTLQKILEGPKEPLEDVVWHPTKPIMASVSSMGTIHMWNTATADTWSAFAPGFEELEENHTYEEHEDEFDIEDKDSLARRKRLEEDYPIDILSISPVVTTIPLPLPLPSHHSQPQEEDGPDAMDTGEEEVDKKPLSSPSRNGGEAVAGEQQQKWWWEDEPDDDDKVDWFMPIRLDAEGKVEGGWEDIY